MSEERHDKEELLSELSAVQAQVEKLKGLRNVHEESVSSLRQYCDTLARLVSEWAHELGDADRKIREENAARKLVEDDLRRTQNFYIGLINALDDPIFVKDEQHRWVFLNDKACELMGLSRDEVLGKSDHDLFPREQADVFREKDREVLEKGEPVVNDEEITWQGQKSVVSTKKSVFVDEYSDTRYIGGIIRDVTDRKRLEQEMREYRNALEATIDQRTDEVTRLKLQLNQERIDRERVERQLQQAQKMEAVGRLAASLAHDFNNLLTGIIGGAEMLHARAPETDSSRPWLEEILNAGRRASKLTAQLLDLSRQQMLKVKVVNLNEIVVNAEWVIRRLLGESISLEVVLDPQLGTVRVDESQMEQVVINLAVNARDAMSAGGNLRIKTANVRVDEESAETHGGAKPGRYVCLTVSDTGHGMDAATMRHIFEPFFTTKPEGRGTGLGLSTVLGIIDEHRGVVSVDSMPDEGTRFHVYLPRVDQASQRLGM